MKIVMRGLAEWAWENPVLAAGEIGVEAVRLEADGSLVFDIDPDTGQAAAKFKTGDGQTAWMALPYADRLLPISEDEFWKAAEEAKKNAAAALSAAEESQRIADNAMAAAKGVDEAARSAVSEAAKAVREAVAVSTALSALKPETIGAAPGTVTLADEEPAETLPQALAPTDISTLLQTGFNCLAWLVDKANTDDSTLRAAYVSGPQDFNTCTNPGIFEFDALAAPAAHINGPPQDSDGHYAGGFLRVTVDRDSEPHKRVMQEYMAWSRGRQHGLVYTRAYDVDVDAWSAWRHNGWQADLSRAVSIPIPTETAKFTMPYDGYLSTRLIANYLFPGGSSKLLCNAGIELITADWDGAANTVSVNFFVHIPKGAILWVMGASNRFIIYPCIGS